ncbi:phosphatidylserine/phosphatidylglycerophosphate/cardiolipin synthase family protein [Myxococcus sp. K38C18041901]|uniref:phospholipase D-like domain-containing protein n=1 Tax=Myxococcus guangdongensis TaxID=2906760 RepID=UPI0020A83641|nr:phosphatidylserine/phosphatidylglycerophosphate/cardiolipin synthase family protein [Myxococcus guangdongensis]MCP3061551.1 phosphatidylserine/phosphatidylglycerophosphate/cardiolipin synthase family protein [Myxococcus guangdongensis]
MFRRLVVVFDAGSESEHVLHAVRRLTSEPEAVYLYGLVPERSELEAPPPTSLTVLDRLRHTLQDWSPAIQVTGALETHLDIGDLVQVSRRHGAELVVLGPLLDTSPRARVGAMLLLALREHLPVLSLGRAPDRVSTEPFRMALAIAPDGRGLGAVASFLPHCAQPSELIALTTGLAPEQTGALQALSKALGITQTLAVESLTGNAASSRAEAFDDVALRSGASLLVVPADSLADLEALYVGLTGARALQEARVPTLLLPRTQTGLTLFEDHHAVSDSLVAPGLSPRFAVERVGLLSSVTLLEPGLVTVFANGTALGEVRHQGGTAIIDAAWLGHLHGLHPLAFSFADPSASRELVPSHVLAPEKPLLLVDSLVEEDTLLAVRELAADRYHLSFVRMRDSDSLDEQRARLREHLPDLAWPLLLDASAWLDDARADDVPRQVDGQRLLRVATRLAAAHVPIAAVITRDAYKPIHPALRTLSPEECEALPRNTPLEPLPLPSEQDAWARELTLAGCSPRTEGHHIDFELDNAQARESVLAAIDAARSTVHWQCYIVEDDPITARITEALKRAATRGVRVRFLADALYSGHDSFGALNPALVGLSGPPNVEVRAIAPLVGGPNLYELKQRNHRKLTLVDSTLAFVSGRNLGAPYYTGFDEVPLGRDTHYRDIPWLDCGARLEGPLVTDLEHAFLAEWTRAGGEPFTVTPSAPAGTMAARIALHEGLKDTHTLDTQLALIRHARSRLVLVNTFPLLLELQNALIAALQRGVRVEVLFGSVRPHHGDARTYFPGGAIREVADRYVRSRLDAVIAAGGIAHELALPSRPGWEPELERLFPHVHAKVLVCDTRAVAVGSANLDVTAAYWESEALLVVEDTPFTERMLAALDALFATSRRIDRQDPRWRDEVEQRAWVGRNWPSLVG